MGKLCPHRCRGYAFFFASVLSLMIGCFLPLCAFAQKIENPFLLPKSKPPQRDDLKPGEDSLDHDLEEMKKRREGRELIENPPIPPVQKQMIKLIEAAKDNPNHRLFMNLALVIPSMMTKAPLENFYAEPTTSFSFLIRPFGSTPDTEAQMWVGARLTSFYGTGTIDGLNARFAYTYFGPAFGFGKVFPAVQEAVEVKEDKPKSAAGSRLPDKVVKEKPPDSDYPTRNALFLGFGLAGQSREVKLSSSREDVPKDFTKANFSFDSPGLWGELTWSHIYYEAYSYQVSAGAQLGNAKTFVWVSFGFGGWY